MFRLEDINETEPGMTSLLSLDSKIAGNCNAQNCFVHPNGLIVSTKISIYIFGVMILQMKQNTKFWKIEPHF